MPVILVEDPADTERDTARQAKADEHDARDLDAQIRAANAAEEQISPAWAAAILSGIATILVVFNIIQSGKANRIARDAYIADRRPWLAQSEIKSGKVIVNGSVVRIKILPHWINTGNSPAIDCKLRGRLFIRPGDTSPKDLDFSETDLEVGLAIIAPNVPVHGPPNLIEIDYMVKASLGHARIFMYSKIDYRDPHDIDTPRYTETCIEVICSNTEAELRDPKIHRVALTFPHLGPNTCS